MSKRRSIVKRSRRRKSKHTKSIRSKKNKRGSRKIRRTKSRGFGSIYGLQAPSKAYAGVYPFSLKTQNSMPNLYNVKRTFTASGN